MMNTYQNSYFSFKVIISDKWKLQTWSTWKKQPLFIEYLQCSDDDIPENEDGYKALFRSVRLIKESPSIISCEFSMEAHWRDSGFDLQSEVVPPSNEIRRVFETARILGVDCQVLTTECDGGSYIRIQQVIIWEALPKIWLSACISGDTESNFKEAKSQFSTLVKV